MPSAAILLLLFQGGIPGGETTPSTTPVRTGRVVSFGPAVRTVAVTK